MSAGFILFDPGTLWAPLGPAATGPAVAILVSAMG